MRNGISWEIYKKNSNESYKKKIVPVIHTFPDPLSKYMCCCTLQPAGSKIRVLKNNKEKREAMENKGPEVLSWAGAPAQG